MITYLYVVLPVCGRRFKNLIFFGEKFIYAYQGNNKRVTKILNEGAWQLLWMSLTIFAAIIFSCLTFVSYPLYTYFFENARPMLIPVIFPYFDPETGAGYYLNVLNQLAISFIGMTGVIGIEFISSKIVNNVLIGVSIIEHALGDIADDFSTGQRSKGVSKMRNIVLQIQDLDRYVNENYESLRRRNLIPELLSVT